MKTTYLLLLPLVCSTPVLLGCSSLTGPHDMALQALRIEPLLSVRNSDSGARGFYQLGRYLQGQNRLQQAEEAYRNALALQADNIDAQSALGAIYSTQGKFDEAIAEFSAILAKNPQLARIHNNLGYTFYLQGNYADAAAAFDKAIALEPDNPRAFNNLALAQGKLGNPEQSQLALARATALTLPKVTAAAANVAEPAPLPALTSGESVRLESPAQLAGVALDISQTASGASAAGTVPNAAAPAATIPAAAADPQDHPFETVDSATPQLLAVAPVSNDMFSVRSLPGEIPQSKSFNFEISNGNGVADLARKVAGTLTRSGLPTPRLSNLKPYQQNRTIIQYRDGFYYDAARLGSKLATAPLLVLDTQMRKNTDVRLVLGKDAVSQVAMFSPNTRKTLSTNHRAVIRASFPSTASEIIAASIPQGF